MEIATSYTLTHVVGYVCVALFLSEAAHLTLKTFTKCEKGAEKRMWEFHKVGTVFVLVDTSTEEALFASQEVAIGFSYERQQGGSVKIIVHKYGDPQDVDAWAKGARKTYLENGLEDMARQVQTISSDRWEVDELNEIFNDHTALKRILQSKGIVLGRS